MSDINQLVIESFDLVGTLGGTLAANIGSTLGSHYATRDIQNPHHRSKVENLSRVAGFAGALGGAYALQNLDDPMYLTRTPFILGAGLGGLAMSTAAGRLSKHLIDHKYGPIYTPSKFLSKVKK